ncbi:MAG: phosphotransferase family protein [Candidatus Woesearchaeota archaeon]
MMDADTATTLVGRRVTRIVRMSGGVNNPTYEFTCEDGWVGILQLISPRYPKKAEREENIASYLSEMKIPVARIIRSDTSKTLIETDYIIKERLPGTTLRDSKIPREHVAKLYEQIGSILNRMHAVRFGSFGELEFTGTNPEVRCEKPTYREAAYEELRTYIEAPTPFSSYREALLEWLEKNIGVFGAEITPRLTHNDFANTNIMVESGTVTGIIDFDNLASSNPVYDLYRLHHHLEPSLTPLALEGFSRTYTHELPDNFDEHVSFYLTTHCLAYLGCWQGIEDTYEPEELERFIETMHADIRTILTRSFTHEP